MQVVSEVIGHVTDNDSRDANISGARTIPCRYADRCSIVCHQFDDYPLNAESFGEKHCIMRHRRRDTFLFVLLTALIAIGCFWAVFVWSERRELADLKVLGDERLRHAVARLQHEIGKFDILPLAIAANEQTGAFLASGDRAGSLEAMNAYLARVNDAAGTMVAFLVDTNGVMVASSNAESENSFIGRDISYRPYLYGEKAGIVTGYYAIGTTDNLAGYYLATPVEADGRRVGVAAVKVDLERIGNDWLIGSDPLMIVSDANNIILLSSRNDWRYLSIGPLEPEKIARFNETQQYNRHILKALDWKTEDSVADGSRMVSITENGRTRIYLADSRYLPDVSMTLTVLSTYTGIARTAALPAVIAAIIVIAVALCIYIVNQRRLVIKERLLTRDALQEAYTRLTDRFEERNRQLRAANDDLRREVAERIQAVQRQKDLQEEMIRTENLAVIGQLSAGLAHEINQPLAALSTLSENAVRFLELNDLSTVRHNLTRICDLVHRMGVLTGQLRSFARRSDGEVGSVDVERSIERAVTLLNHRLQKQKMRIDVRRPEKPITVVGDAVRLEQVLVNLIGNAMDALQGNGEPYIGIRARTKDGKAIIEVADNGHGLSATVIEKLFMPFFSTKKTNGLGLGLAISQDIVRGFGGDLTAANSPEGGAVFRITMPLADT